MLQYNCKGWVRDIPSPFDYRVDNMPEEVQTLSTTVLKSSSTVEEVPIVSLRQGCSPIENQQDLGSCTANAAAGALEYLQKAWFSEYLDMSRLFIYLRTRQLMNPEKVLAEESIGDTGASIRSTVAAIVTCGAPPEKYWPYRNIWQKNEKGIPRFDWEPPEIAKAIAHRFEGLYYVRLETLAHIKAYLRIGFPVIFGFAVFSSISQAEKDGMIPFPSQNDSLEGGHAVLAVGYDNDKQCLEIRNSWGNNWGDFGYGWLPYKYIEMGLADDFWTLLRSGYVKDLL